ncbi:MAG: N-6 DNA methylase [Candidatus Dadabacteria bacterium]|nr:N-6 DNA methylase [Candidatus Dadabacteria bacterium]
MKRKGSDPLTECLQLLQTLGFEATTKTRWERRFQYSGTGEYTITVDTRKKTIDYPLPITLGDRTTSNFDRPENFVVLECVCHLLQKGYDPATLILEKRYKVGRGASGGKSDITVLRRATDQAEQSGADPLLIIECKTWGKEHDEEKQKTINDGGQLFGYLQQDRSAKHLCIYSSRLKDSADGEIEFRCDIIHADDTPEALNKFACREKADNHTVARENVPLFKHADNRESLHHAWIQTYGGAFQPIGIFEDDFTPYAIGYKPLTGKVLKKFNGENGSTKVFNKFMEILRHNNVSDKENAFNRLCAIILAKLIDEGRDPSAILDFQWFPNKDTDEDLIDRLQKLYKRGMKETLGEDITYFEEKDIDDAFMAHRRDMAKNEVKKIFRALKFYTNSDFAFKEVHNKKLFEQNTQVVKEIVELFQGYQMKYTSKEAFLGNLFELLLNSGFKQSEGQFFTPVPIARFIVRCLPLRERMAAAHESGQQQVIPRVMDYACGSAHFLTEAIEEIQEDLKALGLPEGKTTTWARDTVWGVEKDYRLARTAKIAMFLHGAGDANILHEDGLAHTNPVLPAPGTVDVLIANPPYSIKDFKQHLTVPSDAYTLLPHLTNTSGEIETLFVERAAQLLRPGGMAGLILPSSILTNKGIYHRTRALLLKKFLLRGIVEMGSSTFIATGTNTIILFLERRPENHHEHISIRANALFNEGSKPNDDDFADSDLIRAYTKAAGLDFADYCAWLADPSGMPPAALAKTPLFKAYEDEFNNLTDTKNRKKQTSFKKQSKAEQATEMHGKYIHYAREAERNKFTYFALAFVEDFNKGELIPQHTTVLSSAGDKAEEQAFLGYKWSQRRGTEGMVYLRGESYDGGALYTPDTTRDESSTKAAHHIRAAFLGNIPGNIPERTVLHGKGCVAATSDCLDFTRANCDLTISLSPAESDVSTPVFDTQYELVSLGQITEIVSGGTPNTKVDKYWNGNIPWLTVSDFRGKSHYVESAEKSITEEGLNNSNTQILNAGDLVISARGTVGEIAQLAKPMAFNQTCYGLRGKKGVDNCYLLFALRMLADQMKARSSGATFGSITTRTLETFQIPLPPLNIQQRIVKDIEKIEAAKPKPATPLPPRNRLLSPLLRINACGPNASQKSATSLKTNLNQATRLMMISIISLWNTSKAKPADCYHRQQ